jgi:hypothetical protein
VHLAFVAKFFEIPFKAHIKGELILYLGIFMHLNVYLQSLIELSSITKKGEIESASRPPS